MQPRNLTGILKRKGQTRKIGRTLKVGNLTFTKVLSGAKKFEIRPKSSANLSSVFVIFLRKVNVL